MALSAPVLCLSPVTPAHLHQSDLPLSVHPIIRLSPPLSHRGDSYTQRQASVECLNQNTTSTTNRLPQTPFSTQQMAQLLFDTANHPSLLAVVLQTLPNSHPQTNAPARNNTGQKHGTQRRNTTEHSKTDGTDLSEATTQSVGNSLYSARSQALSSSFATTRPPADLDSALSSPNFLETA